MKMTGSSVSTANRITKLRLQNLIGVFVVAWMLSVCLTVAQAQSDVLKAPALYGPYNGIFLPDGIGLRVALGDTSDPVLQAKALWSISCWINTNEPVAKRQLVAGIGNISAEYPRYLALDAGKVLLWMGQGNELSARADLRPGTWHLLAATFERENAHLYLDGHLVASGPLKSGIVLPVLQIAPPDLAHTVGMHFGGRIASFLLARNAWTGSEVLQMQQTPPAFALLNYEEGSKPWPVQIKGQSGYRAPQDPATMPVSRGKISTPVAIQRPPVGPSLKQTNTGDWNFADGWTLQEAQKVNADGAQISTVAYQTTGWLRGTVPGTVLTTMVDDGIYPDPDHGMNNLAIPESISHQNYWYRNEFTIPSSLQESSNRTQKIELAFQGINYRATIWLNGALLGTIDGAFQRGIFDVTNDIHMSGENVLAVRISPPPHPGIPQEQSIAGGPGENGGLLCLDGPTFVATEGWDWIPGIRDRDTGIWQPVTLRVTGGLKLGDVQVVTTFRHHDKTEAAIKIDVPISNLTQQPITTRVVANIEQIKVEKQITVQPGESVVTLAPEEFSQLNLHKPRLWWPNGYGKPELYLLNVSLGDSDMRAIRFGVREVSYELSLLDATGHLRRVEFTPAVVRGAMHPIVDVSHEGMREIPAVDAVALKIPEEQREKYHSYAASLGIGAERSPAIEVLSDHGSAPYLTIKVNGVRIAARGGNWGMDDARKRVTREHLEPFFQLHRDANLNIIRNWVGQSTEETFFDLADEYGLMVWNDFWESTQDYNLEAEDSALFLANASDTIKHFRNHPSIVIWCGRNEGVPQPVLNEGLERLARTLDGTRYYIPSSNRINLQGSGPYKYRAPSEYFTTLSRGFAVEVGTPSMSTLESFTSIVEKEDQWPINDVWAYHDWHQSRGGDVTPFMNEVKAEFGVPTSLEDFERKAQMLNYVDHRAIFEGMNASLWAPNSGRLLWMTQPAWPSTTWQIMTSDYDTQASFYGVKKACEPLHIQLNLATYQVDVVNTTTVARTGLTVTAKVYSLTSTLLYGDKVSLNVSADVSVEALKLNLTPYLPHGVLLVKLELFDAAGILVSQNIYWLGSESSSYRELNTLPETTLQASASMSNSDGKTDVKIQLTNNGKVASLMNKLTLVDAVTKKRILPAYYSDNYVSLLPGETRLVEIEYPDSDKKKLAVTLRGWNGTAQSIVVQNVM